MPVTLFAALLLSDLADRSVLSTAVLFLVAGFLVGPGMLHFLHLTHDSPIVKHLAELALFSALFTDGMRAGIRDLINAWQLPGRALLLGMPLTLIATALLAYFLADVSWIEALLVGAILSPTDPVFAAAIIGRKEIPGRLKHLLNVESGVNDGLALPLVLVCLSVIGHYEAGYGGLALELFLGIAIGVVVPLLACWFRRSRFFGVAKSYEPLFAVAIGLLVLATASLTHANIFLAAFAAGVTVASTRPSLRDEFHRFGDWSPSCSSWPLFLSSVRSSRRGWSWSCTRRIFFSPLSPCSWRDRRPCSSPCGKASWIGGNASRPAGSAPRVLPPLSTGCSCSSAMCPTPSVFFGSSRSSSRARSSRTPRPTCCWRADSWSKLREETRRSRRRHLQLQLME